MAPLASGRAKSKRLGVAVTADEHALANWYAETLNVEVSKLLRIISVGTLLESARRLERLNPHTMSPGARLQLVARETARFARALSKETAE
jgi:hypothetical protein